MSDAVSPSSRIASPREGGSKRVRLCLRLGGDAEQSPPLSAYERFRKEKLSDLFATTVLPFLPFEDMRSLRKADLAFLKAEDFAAALFLQFERETEITLTRLNRYRRFFASPSPLRGISKFTFFRWDEISLEELSQWLPNLSTLELPSSEPNARAFRAFDLSRLPSLFPKLHSLSFDSAISQEWFEQLLLFKELRALKIREDGVDAPYLPFEGFERIVRLEKLEHLRLDNMALTEAHFSAIASLVHLKSLKLEIATFTRRHFSYLPSLPQLEKLSFDHSQVGDEALAGVGKCAQLKNLSLENTLVSDRGLEFLAPLVQLKELNLSFTDVEGSGLAFLRSCKDLEGLSLRNTRVDDQDLSHLLPFEKLKFLDLSDTLVTGAGLGCLAHLRDLERLDLGVSGEGLYPHEEETDLSYLPPLPHLKELQLFCLKLSKKGLFALSHLPRLEELELACSSADDLLLPYLSGLKHLRDINLNSTKITNRALSSLLFLPSLKYLSVMETRVTKQALETFWRLREKIKERADPTASLLADLQSELDVIDTGVV